MAFLNHKLSVGTLAAMEPKDKLENFLVRRMLEDAQPPPKCVLFVDMLGFSNLTEQHPNP